MPASRHGLGAGLGLAVAGVTGTTTVANVVPIVLANSAGSGLIAGGLKYFQNWREGECDLSEGVDDAVFIGAATGLAGSALGEDIDAFATGIRAFRATRAQQNFLDLPLDVRGWGLILDKVRRDTFYITNPKSAPYPPVSRATKVVNGIPPAISLTFANSGRSLIGGSISQ